MEDIVAINNAHVVDMEQINKIRQNRIDAFSAQLKILQHRQIKKSEKLADNLFRLKRDETQLVTVINSARQGLCPAPRPFLQMQNELQDIRDFITSEQTNTQIEVNRLQQEIEALKAEADFIQLVPKSKNERFWILSSETGQVGFLPATGNHELVLATKNPSESDILKVVAWHPSSKSTNVPLSIKNIILYNDKLGLNDDSLLQCLLMYLKKCKQEIY